MLGHVVIEMGHTYGHATGLVVTEIGTAVVIHLVVAGIDASADLFVGIDVTSKL